MNLFEEKNLNQKHYWQLAMLALTFVFFIIIKKDFTEIFLFAFGFIWQWGDQFVYVSTRAAQKKYRYSYLRFYFEFIQALGKIQNKWMQILFRVLAPIVFMGLIFTIFQTPFYFHEILMGSFFMMALKLPQFRGEKSAPNSLKNL